MRYFLLTGMLLLSLLSSGEANKVVLTGTITMQTGEQFPYKIIATETNGRLKGYSVTYDEPDETRVTIEGTVDKQRKAITIRETEVLSAHNVHTKAFMCLVNARLEYNINMLTGKAQGRQLDNTACTDGVIVFKNRDEISSLFSSHDKYDVEVTMGGEKKQEAPRQAPEETVPVKTDKITTGVDVTYDWHTDSVVIEVWDGGTFDGDKVTLMFDADTLLSKYTIQKRKKRIAVYLPATGVHSLVIRADDEGFEIPNTANMMLTDGAQPHSVLAYNSKGSSSLVYIKRAK
jgi:hypothetical protein